jgi:RimJ/RimL family protein N-acetyltransferase
MTETVKAKSIYGKTLFFQNVTTEHAEFILKARTDISKSKYLSATSGDLNDQMNWIKNYQVKNDQAYFVIFFEKTPIGTVRIYDPIGDSFCWGSWILINDAPFHAAIESALIVYSYALKHLNFNRSHFDVRKENIKVRQFHERFGAKVTGEDEDNYYYLINKEEIELSLKKYKKFLDKKLEVELYYK